MIDYTIYNTSTGLIHTTGTSGCDSVNDIVLNSGDSIIEGIYKQDAYKIISGTPQAYTPNFLNRLRKKRDYLLQQCDWTQGNDSPLSTSKKTEWVTYRQALRDLPANNSSATSFNDVTFPTEPT
jgi:hypothetical protein|tara:strand:+ start:4727 stop:5098 length:372 start_codon:yes stop_codon:yes gene_type:complete